MTDVQVGTEPKMVDVFTARLETTFAKQDGRQRRSFELLQGTSR